MTNLYLKRILIWGAILFTITMVLVYIFRGIAILLIPISIIFTFTLIYILVPRKVFCADCGYYLGWEFKAAPPCPRCGGNVYTYSTESFLD